MVQMTVASPAGTGPISLGSPVTDTDGITYLSLSQSGAIDGDLTSYRISDGVDWELSRGIVSGGRSTLTRQLIKSSTGGLLNVSGLATVSILALAEDFVDPGNQTITISGDVLGSGTTGIPATVAGLRGRRVTTAAPLDGQVLMWNSAANEAQWTTISVTPPVVAIWDGGASIWDGGSSTWDG
jgi:hypothetical protein